ncbi:hypothetical protein DLE01_37615 [Streptomyces sp. FT05W]|uniref:hypothetical protein n=1 Tax=[Kitasatospora] papulosa TaxID=1464011 RepID=UPI000D6FA547|nr:hypothetical protein [Streptomyces sp. FT05W]PWS45669.1 hypothetical protein DLE01_37615 [Streptomyces sp. FT05W]
MPAPDAADALAPGVTDPYKVKFVRRLPGTLEELRGPRHGVVQLPLHVAWSGLTAFDLDRPRSRMSLYRTVLAEGLCDDLRRYLDRDLLLELWPVLRNLIGRAVREAWEESFPELSPATGGATAA